MVEHAGAGGILSLLIVAAFAVLLHEKESPPQPQKPATVAEKVVQVTPSPAPAPASPQPPPAPAPLGAIIETASSRAEVPMPPTRPEPAPPVRPDPIIGQAQQVRSSPVISPGVETVSNRPAQAKARPRMVQRRVEAPAPAAAQPPAPAPASARAPRPLRPRSAFAEVMAGETLDDVAERVYGTRSAVDILLRANRDQVRSSDRPLEAGTWLRTP